jgi:hypothetical protein
MLTSRDFLDYTHENTLLYDTREVAEFEIQNKYWPEGLMPI